MRESTIETKVCDHAKKLGWTVYKFVSPGNKSVPDRIFMKDGKVFFIEFKAPGKKPTKLQVKTISDMELNGFKVYVCDNVNYGKLFINLKNEYNR